ncbi:MAG: ubiquitin-binding protein [Pelagibacteraceae bacterium]|nr:ubiquitin-binding protein [Pelagibacteraceae bacterium]OUV88232.1 MAG: ubiquitin-binding protein [Pelagibacteraceae bacterium TMED146]|tara:strand:+ start:774 stop:959 length:186 start_codon:yes stop_codon:yes gene_type:complete
MKELIVAIGLLFVIEGLLYSIFPEQMKGMMEKMKSIPSSNLRTGGLFFALIGFIIVWVIKR